MANSNIKDINVAQGGGVLGADVNRDNDLLILWDDSQTGADRTRTINLTEFQKIPTDIRIESAPSGAFVIIPYSQSFGGFGIAIGKDAAISATTATGYTAIGTESGKLCNGSYWSAIGAGASPANLTGNYWTAIGTSAGLVCTGSSYTAVGSLAALSNTTGNYWTAVGSSAAGANISGVNWTAVGALTAPGNTTGSSWTAVGLFAAYGSTTGGNFTAVGTYAAYSATTDTGFVAIGYFAGFYETGNDWLAIDSGFYLDPLIGGNFSSRNVGFNSKNFGGGSAVVSLPEAITVPTANPVSGATLYCSAGHTFLRTTNGISQITPLKGSKTSTGSATETISVTGAAVGDIATLSISRVAAVTAPGVVTFDSTGYTGLVNCIVTKF